MSPGMPESFLESQECLNPETASSKNRKWLAAVWWQETIKWQCPYNKWKKTTGKVKQMSDKENICKLWGESS